MDAQQAWQDVEDCVELLAGVIGTLHDVLTEQQAELEAYRQAQASLDDGGVAPAGAPIVLRRADGGSIMVTRHQAEALRHFPLSQHVPLVTLAEVMGVKTDTVWRYVKELQDKGLVERTQRGVYRRSVKLYGDPAGPHIE